ncbi:AMP-binding protein [Streptomyces sp. NPDC127117]|uniref:AMP-binding protein n=1 Tax=Streptomyces sp. NPDC127117 TaxID=3345368 RepID=UPI003631A0DE
MQPGSPSGEIRSRGALHRAAVVAPSSDPVAALADLLQLPREGEWRRALEDGSRALVVCRAGRSLDEVTAVLWLLDAGVPIVLVDRPNGRQSEHAIETLDATHVFEGGTLRRRRERRAESVHRDRMVSLPTSGSSGHPKYVSLSAESVMGNAASVATTLGLGDDDIGVTTLSPAYSYGLSNVLAHVIAGGTMLCVDDSIASERFWQRIRDEATTSLAFAASSASLVLTALRRSMMPRTLRRVMFAGGGVDRRLVPDLYRETSRVGVSLHLMYGQTEAGPRITISAPDTERTDWGTAGASIHGVRTRVVNSSGGEQRAGREGGIQVASPYIMAGYSRSADDLTCPRERIHWLDTGDRGRQDVTGRLWVSGRAGDERKVSGYRIDLANLRDEAESIFRYTTTALASPNLVTVCLKTADRIPPDHPQLANLAQRVNLPIELIRIVTIEEFPRNSSGKVDRVGLAERAGHVAPEIGEED